MIVESVSCAIVTASDTRTEKTDQSGALIRERLTAASHRVHGYQIIPDEPSQIRDRVLALCSEEACQAVLLNGGTGVSL